MSKAPTAIVVGAGIGGLAAAIELAADGADVTVIERGSVPGGRMRELMAMGQAIDSGPTVFTMRWVFDQLFARAGRSLEEAVTLERADRLARHRWTDGSELDLYSDVEASASAIEAFAGAGEAAGYRRFARDSEEIFATLADSFMTRDKPSTLGLTLSMGLAGLPRLYATRPFNTLWDRLGHYFEDERLRQLFARYATYTGSSPFAAPATLMLIAHVERVGVHYVGGGMQRLAEALADTAASLGAEFRYDCHVDEILSRRGRVEGVVADGERLAADAVVFNGDVQAFSRGLLGEAMRSATLVRNAEPRSLSAITWSLVADTDGAELDHHTVFFGADYPEEFHALLSEGRVAESPTVYVCAQDRGGAERPAGPERLFVLVNAPARLFGASEIEAVRDSVTALLGQGGLDLTLDGEDVAAFSPNDFAARFPGSDGAIYGWPTHGMFGSFRRSGARSSVRGLYFAGGSVHPGPGVPMVAISGRLAAAAAKSDWLR